MNLLIASDLHLEFLRYAAPSYGGSRTIKRLERRRVLTRDLGFNMGMVMSAGLMLNASKAEVIVLAGDIGLGVDAVAWAIIEALAEQKPLIYIAGNHELYGQSKAQHTPYSIRSRKSSTDCD